MAKEGAADAPNDAKVVNEVQVGLLGQKSTEIRGDRQRSGGNWFALEKKFRPSRNTASKARFKKCLQEDSELITFRFKIPNIQNFINYQL